MKKNIFNILFFFFICYNCFSQSAWIQCNSGVNSNLYSVKFVNSNTGWCVGQNGKILKTTNGGISWFLQSSNVSYDLKYLSITSVNIGYCAGYNNIILKSTNGGLSWTPMIIDKLGLQFLTSIFFVNDSVGYCGGINSEYLFRTSNGGQNWTTYLDNNYYVTSIFFINELTGWVSKSNNIIEHENISKTTNGGENFIGGIGGFRNIKPIFFYDSLSGWFSTQYVSMLQNFYRTVDGVNWINYPLNGIPNISEIFFTTRNKGFGVNGPKIMYSTNSGVNWTVQFINNTVSYNSIYFTDSLTGWVVGDSGIILKTTTGGIITAINNNSSEIPNKFSLSQNYPNPFNPNTIINYELRITSYVSLKIFDLLGNEVATIVNEKQNQGSYNYQFSTVNYQLASGIYFYTLTAGDFSETKRMLLIK